MANIVLFPGDGVGPEVVAEAVKVLAAIQRRFAIEFSFETLAIGGEALDRYGVPLRPEDIRIAGRADASLLGAVGGPMWDAVEPSLRPERGLLQIRKALRLFANLRPVTVSPALVGISPLKPEIVEGVDFLVVRELTGGIYFGKPSRRWVSTRGRAAVDTLRYREDEIARVVRLGFQLARSRRGRLTSVDKSNVLQSSRLWREIANELSVEFDDVELEHVLVDAMAMHLVRNPGRFDVIVTENMFGDILTDEASVLPGSIGLLPSASLTSKAGRKPGTRYGLYEPIHGSAPDIAGTGRANPAGTILSAAMMLRWSLGLPDAGTIIEQAVEDAIASGTRTPDIAEPGTTAVSTEEFGDAVVGRIDGN
ncbi:MAG: 3-isopropylmalate dehydrogenase [Chloroflexia bacterium]|nr:3-isopropylmalate dehydrogenase [Chloroflexia bacterium]